MPREFFDRKAQPNYQEWLAKPLDERLASNAVGDANVMAERVYRHWESHDPSKLGGAKNAGEYRAHLANMSATTSPWSEMLPTLIST